MSLSAKKITFLLVLIALSSVSFAQTSSETKKGRPNIPGTFQVDLGFNFPKEIGGFNTSFFGSTAINIYYFYDMRMGNSKFSFHPGVGLGLDRYKFNNFKTLGYDASGDSAQMVLSSLAGLVKTKLITNYIDVPLELRFSSRPDDPNKSFKVSLGVKVGILYDSFTKQKYKQDGENKKIKDKQNYNLNPIRYGAYIKIGAGNIAAFAHYNFSPLFKKGVGPGGADDINNLTVGISLAAF